MNKVFKKSDRKDKFITDHLLGYLISSIENSESSVEMIDEVASMYIFPYRTENEIKIGSLNEPGISWYYDSQQKRNTVSSGSYKILANEVLKPDQVQRLNNIFNKYISEFSDNVVIEFLIKKMSYEEDYTEAWWTYAYDVFKLWNPVKFNSVLSKATARIKNKSFLFLKDYCDDSLKEKLLKYDIFEDILTPKAKRLFWDKIPKSEKEKAITVLKYMGVPHSFVIHEQDGIITEYKINANLIKFAEEIANTVDFPVDSAYENYDRCNLCHELFMDRIYRESKDAFEAVISDSSVNGGIAVKNTQGAYVPLSWNLFYSRAELYEDESKEEVIEIDDSEFEYGYLHIDPKLYDRSFIEAVKTIHEFTDVKETAGEYGIENDMEFYRWIWKYSHHEELAENILYALSDEDDRTIDSDYNAFVLSVIEDENVLDQGYSFDINLNCKEAFAHSSVINKLFLSFEEVYAVINGDCSKLDVEDFVKRILNATTGSFQEKANIENDDIWNHVYIVKENDRLYEGKYIGGYFYDDGDYIKALILWHSDDVDLYVRALAEYVRDHFNVDVSEELVKSYDWKQEYYNLIYGIKNFIFYKTDKKSIDDLYGYVAQMNDVESFGDEKKIWHAMKMQQKKITEHETGGCPVNFSSWRQFLSAKYKGRCQLCGGKTVTGEQNAHFYTFRVVKESDNQLANMASNLFCLCPSCWGEMGHGDFMGKDMSEIVIKAEKYVNCLNEYLKSDQMEDDFDPAVKELLEIQDLTDEEEKRLEGFVNPIVCRVVVNGKDRCMAFSWEHFIKLAFILSEANKQA